MPSEDALRRAGEFLKKVSEEAEESGARHIADDEDWLRGKIAALIDEVRDAQLGTVP